MDAGGERLLLDAQAALRLEQAARKVGGIQAVARMWPQWGDFSRHALIALSGQAEVELKEKKLDLVALLALGSEPSPNRPNRALRRAAGVMLAWRRLQAWPLDNPLTPSLISELVRNIEAPHLARGKSRSTGQPVDLVPGAAVWSLAPRWTVGGMPPLWVAGLALASWEREGPSGPQRSVGGRALMAGLAPRLGLPAQAFCGLGFWFAEAASELAQGLESLTSAVREAGAWRRFVEVFLSAVERSAGRVLDLCEQAQELETAHLELINTWVKAPRHPRRLLRLFVGHPVLDLPNIAAGLSVTQRTAGLLVEKLKELGLLTEITGQRRGRRYAYGPLVELLQPGWQNPVKRQEPDSSQDNPAES